MVHDVTLNKWISTKYNNNDNNNETAPAGPGTAEAAARGPGGGGMVRCIAAQYVV